ncbi:hypothetical protein HEK616_43420 [Streptomyces nigrescens]|uniref:Uncharacterized protein n=2 Tax=Streptomyces TaxID=1883 RepID=A0ABM7ZWY3_STRNI|nr:hypothetical protein [Streptomyces nigrescens]MEE4420266.1 hypothetical protein [Streptomyces sp. DSM 41528]BDM70855.1 hypothetical protein HEK616_43420 [Streptomyces nigrescens]
MIPFYVPKFSHTDWIDNEDRVQAGGENGFNIRFHHLESEFATLAKDHLNPVIRALSNVETSLSLVPILAPSKQVDQPATPPLTPAAGQPLPAPPPPVHWELVNDFAQKPSTATEAHGIMNITLPDGAEIKSLTMTGTRQPVTGVMPTAVLRRRVVTGDEGAQEIVKVSAFNVPAIPAVQAIVNNRTHRHFLQVDLPTVPVGDTVKLFCFQITYQ